MQMFTWVVLKYGRNHRLFSLLKSDYFHAQKTSQNTKIINILSLHVRNTIT